MLVFFQNVLVFLAGNTNNLRGCRRAALRHGAASLKGSGARNGSKTVLVQRDRGSGSNCCFGLEAEKAVANQRVN